MSAGQTPLQVGVNCNVLLVTAQKEAAWSGAEMSLPVSVAPRGGCRGSVAAAEPALQLPGPACLLSWSEHPSHEKHCTGKQQQTKIRYWKPKTAAWTERMGADGCPEPDPRGRGRAR